MYLVLHKDVKLVGLTATPMRTDDTDVLTEIFGGYYSISIQFA